MDEYIYIQSGNTIRRMKSEERLLEIEALPKREIKKKKSLSIKSIRNFIILTGLSVILTFMLVHYLDLHSKIQNSMQNVVVLERQLNRLKQENQEKEVQLKADVDLKQIYNIATKRLGMVHPDNNLLINFQSPVREYVRQNDDIPSSD